VISWQGPLPYSGCKLLKTPSSLTHLISETKISLWMGAMRVCNIIIFAFSIKELNLDFFVFQTVVVGVFGYLQTE
jgi:hypothetical protein